MLFYILLNYSDERFMIQFMNYETKLMLNMLFKAPDKLSMLYTKTVRKTTNKYTQSTKMQTLTSIEVFYLYLAILNAWLLSV